MPRTLLGLATTALLVAGGCAQTGEDPPYTEAAQEPTPPTEPLELTIRATDFEFELPATLPAGRYDFTLINEGEQIHHAQFYSLAEGVSYDEYREVMLSHPEFTIEAQEGVADLVAGAPTGVLANVRGEETGTATGELEPGEYAVICLLPDLEPGTGVGSGQSHHALGMMAELQVTSP